MTSVANPPATTDANSASEEKVEKKEADISFRIVRNDGKPQSVMDLIQLKNVFAAQLPKMPKEYIVRLVLDRGHKCFAICDHNKIIGGIAYRPFESQEFAEIVFCAISGREQVKGYGTRLMNHLKEHVKKENISYFLTYADNYATGYFQKQGFSKIVSLPRTQWEGWIKDYEGGTLMECKINKLVNYLDIPGMVRRQREQVIEKIKTISNSHHVYEGLTCFGDDLTKEVSIELIPGVLEAGWKPPIRSSGRVADARPSMLTDLCAKLGAVLKGLKACKDSWPFEMPVDPKQVADYTDVIDTPMDLSTMEKKLNAFAYRTPELFVHDVNLIISNAKLYNTPDTTYYRCACNLVAPFHALLRQQSLEVENLDTIPAAAASAP